MPASSDPLRSNCIFPVERTTPLIGEITTGAAGQEASSNILSVVSVVIFPKPSLNLIYTIFVPSPLGNVRAIEEEHDCRLVGDALEPNATCSPFIPVSVAHVVVKNTLVPVVYVALACIVNDHPLGGVASYI